VFQLAICIKKIDHNGKHVIGTHWASTNQMSMFLTNIQTRQAIHIVPLSFQPNSVAPHP
jgi:hypothetical protein